MENNFFEQQQQKINNKKPENKTATFILLALFYVLACVYPPISTLVNMGTWLSAVAALGMCVFAAFALFRMSGSLKPLMGYVIIVAAFALFGVAFLPMALLVCFVSGAVVYAYLLRSRLSAAVWGLPAVAALVAGLVTLSPVGVFLSLCSLPASVMVSFAIKNKTPRVGAVCRISLGICLSVLAALGLSVYLSSGEISVTAVKSLIDYAKEQMTLLLSDALSQMQDMLGGLFMSVETENLIALIVSSVFNLLPAMIITAANIVSYIIHSLYLASQYSMTREAHEEAKPMLTFDMSVVSAAVYILSLVLSLVLVSPETAIYGTLAQNLLLILIPGLVLTALAYIRTLSIVKGPSCLGTLLYFVVIFLVIGLNPIALMLVSLAGAVFIILAHIANYRKEHKKD